jgi:uncharacterized protein (TIGR03084 family)
MATTTPDALLDDLQAEYEELRAVVGSLDAHDPRWDLPTPAEGWAVRDQVSHLAFFDDAGRQALVEPERFARMAADAMSGTGDPMAPHLTRGRSMDGDELVAWWDGAHAGMMAALAEADPSTRIPWFGPPMGLLSFASARLMETWAHGQDVVDALGPDLAGSRVPTDRLRHVAHLGVRTRPFAYAVHDRPVPDGTVEIRLTAPSGATWSWDAGEGPRAGGVAGPAVDFCLVVTRRRHLDDTDLAVDGVAGEWLGIAQAFAGPPGGGRAPLTGS